MKYAARSCAFAVTYLSLVLVSHAQTALFSAPNAFGNLLFPDPVAIVSPPGETNRLFIVEQEGYIVVITNLTEPNQNMFLDISAQVLFNGEQGLLGLAFHPDYANNRLFYVTYTTRGARNDRLSRFETSPSNPNQAMPASEQILINQPDDFSNHNAGDMHFGSDGYLYVSLGDEGDANDTGQNSQRIDKDFFSGIIRIDVDKRAGNLAPNLHAAISNPANYAIPSDNPFVGATTFNGLPVIPTQVRTEFWAVGLRNPWRWCFDPTTGILYCADVGQGAREEIDIIEKGKNYGWNFREGFIARPGSGAPPAGFNRTDPILDYGRGTGPDQGSSVTGGVVYRGDRIPTLYGRYVFADYVSGNVWTLLYDGSNNGLNDTPFERILDEPNISAFGIDPANGDVLMADLGDNMIRRLVFTEPSALLVSVVPRGSPWKYKDDGSNQDTAWRAPDFDDSGWAQGPAELGYGDLDEDTPINGGPETDRFITSYFRHAWNVADPSLYSSLQINVLRDDGAVVYLNGVEVLRSNMPEGAIGYQTPASLGVNNADETIYYSTPLDPLSLQPGRNVLAVEVHQINNTSSDVSFDLELAGEVYPNLDIRHTPPGPLVTWPAPSPGFALQTKSNFTALVWQPAPQRIVRSGAQFEALIDPLAASAYFRLAKIDPLVIQQRPQSVTTNTGSTVTFTVAATGNAPLSYQWSFNGVPITGANTPTYTIASASLDHAGNYTVDITDNLGQTVSATASLSVLQVPVVLQQPQSQTVNVGDNVTFTVSVNASVPIWYRWRRGNTTLANLQSTELTSSYTINNVQLTHAGNYSVVMTNAASHTPGVLSSTAVLTVVPPP